MNQREECIYMAKLAEQAERYKEMAESMKCVALMNTELTHEERNLFSVAFKNEAGALRAAWRIVCSIELKEMNKGDHSEHLVSICSSYRKHLECELRKLCGEVLLLIDEHLIPFAAANSEAFPFYYKMKGDFYRYTSEVSEGDGKQLAIDNSTQAYAQAEAVISALPATHPTRLGMALSIGVFSYEIHNDKERAIRVARPAYEAALPGLDTLSEDEYKEASLLMTLLKDNLALWEGNQTNGTISNNTLSKQSTPHDGFNLEEMSLEDCMYVASITESAERYKDMVEATERVAMMKTTLSDSERNFFSVAHKNEIGQCRSAWRIVRSIELKEVADNHLAGLCANFRMTLETETKEICTRIIRILDARLIHEESSSEALVFYHKMKGDYYSYIAEVSEGEERVSAAENCRQSRETAYAICTTELSPVCPLRLSMSLNRAVHFYEFLNDVESAIQIAKAAFDSAVSDLDNLTEEDYKDSIVVMSLLRDNLILWTQEISNDFHG